MEIEGLVLQAIPFKEKDHIVTLFTPQALLKLFVKGKQRVDAKLSALITPFTIAEYTCQETKSDLYRFLEGKILDQNLRLREKLSFYETAQQLLRILLTSQWPGKPSLALYILTVQFLKRIPQTEKPEQLIAPFLLKLLKHEGILDLSFFSQEEQERVEILVATRSFTMIDKHLPGRELAQKIEEYYSSVI